MSLRILRFPIGQYADLRRSRCPDGKAVAGSIRIAASKVTGATKACVRFGSEAAICSAKSNVRFTPNSDRESGPPANGHVRYPRKQTCAVQSGMSALGQ